MLGGPAEFERELIRAHAKARGVKIGCKAKRPHHQQAAIAQRETGDETLAAIGRRYYVSGWTISRLTV